MNERQSGDTSIQQREEGGMLFSLILRVATRLLIPLLLLFSIFLLLRGHSSPGGGFVGGLVAGSSFVLYAFSRGDAQARRVLGVAPRLLLGTGLACALGAGLLALGLGEPFLHSLWTPELTLLGGHMKAGSTLLFDIGVFFVVVGTVLLMVFSIGETGQTNTADL
jgi:multicomponent Na+:H+ antiporter subunit B